MSQSNDTLVIFDFDNTLFRTKRFWRAYVFPRLLPLGIGQETAEAAFVEATQVKADYFVEEYFAESLAERASASRGDIDALLANILYELGAEEWFFEDAEDAVRRAKEKYENVRLLTYGDTKFKEKFFATNGIYDWFKKESVTITNGSKLDAVESWKDFSRAIFINDVAEETVRIVSRGEDYGIKIDAYLVNEVDQPLDPRYTFVRRLEEILF